MGLEQRLALGVVCPGLRGVVPLAAVGLDDEAVLRPAEVGDDPAALEADRDIDVAAAWRPAASSRS